MGLWFLGCFLGGLSSFIGGWLGRCVLGCWSDGFDIVLLEVVGIPVIRNSV
jgi:hypothetical protein